jgi:hypothetical protein
LEPNFVTSSISAHFHKLQVGNILAPDWVQVSFLINFAKLVVGILSKYEVLSPELMETMSTQTNTCEDRRITPAEHHVFFLQRAAVHARHR